MPKIEDMRHGPKARKHALDGLREGFSTSAESQWIKITLHGQKSL